MISAGIKTMIVSCNDTLGASFLGRIIDAKTVEDLEQKGVDVCGENGEFHTVVLDCPLFQQSIEVTQGEKLVHNNYHF
jgi:diphthamide synthase (EF-2-diphthine--ammonia ligase)